jgi:hypothetical protein
VKPENEIRRAPQGKAKWTLLPDLPSTAQRQWLSRNLHEVPPQVKSTLGEHPKAAVAEALLMGAPSLMLENVVTCFFQTVIPYSSVTMNDKSPRLG